MAMGRVADAVSGHWVDTGAPMHWRPYLRLMRAERPIGWWLLLLPCWQSLALAIGATGFRWIDLWLVVAFFIGAVAMRGAGCVLNDIVDRKIDAQVERTRSRPIPSGAVTVRQAAVFMAALCFVSLLVLLTMNWGTVLLAFGSLAIVAVYPFAKRVTNCRNWFWGWRSTGGRWSDGPRIPGMWACQRSFCISAESPGRLAMTRSTRIRTKKTM
jgi:4-hydroxybenzoate polyprenyltransferase